MRGLIASFVLCTIAFMQVESYVITVDSLVTTDESPISVETGDYEDYDEEFQYEGVYEYVVVLGDDGDSDIPIEYFYIDDDFNIVDSGLTTLCSANLTNPNGTVAAIVALALGMRSDPVCPPESSKFSQKSVFVFEGGDFSNLPSSEDEDDILSVKLEVYSSNYLSMKLSITDEDFWFEDDNMEDPDEDAGEVTDEEAGEGTDDVTETMDSEK